jgi:hypothetical protein
MPFELGLACSWALSGEEHQVAVLDAVPRHRWRHVPHRRLATARKAAAESESESESDTDPDTESDTDTQPDADTVDMRFVRSVHRHRRGHVSQRWLATARDAAAESDTPTPTHADADAIAHRLQRPGSLRSDRWRKLCQRRVDSQHRLGLQRYS